MPNNIAAVMNEMQLGHDRIKKGLKLFYFTCDII